MVHSRANKETNDVNYDAGYLEDQEGFESSLRGVYLSFCKSKNQVA